MRAIPVLLLFIFSVGIAHAGDEQGISQQLREQKTVVLEAKVYMLEGPVLINSGNSLIGQPGTVLKVSEKSSQWFLPGKGIIYSEGSVDNILIENIEIDGNCQNLPREFANSPGHDKDCEKAIVLKGASDRFSNNITIRNVNIHDCFSDAIYIGFCNSVFISKLEGINCQHSTIYLCEVKGGIIQGCEIWGITSDNIRVENSLRVEVLKNLLYTYTGDHANGAWPGGQNFVQVGDQTPSHGYGSSKPDHTQDINIHDNVMSGKNWHTIWINNVQSGANVWVHNNTYIDLPEVETTGKGFSVEHPPTIEQAEQTFSSIYDFLKKDYIFQYPDLQQDFKASATVTYQNYSIEPYSLVEVQGEHIKVVKYSYAGKEVRHFLDRNIWTGELGHAGNAAYLPGKYQHGELQITVYGDAGFQKVENITVSEQRITKAGFNPDLFIFIAVLAVLGISITRSIRRIL